MELSKLTNKEMKAVLQALKDKTSGSKQELILRLQKYDEEVLKRTISEIHERSIQIDNDDLNESHDADGGAGSVSQLRMEVANLTATVHALMQQLQDKTSTQSNSDTHIAQQKQDDTSKQSNAPTAQQLQVGTSKQNKAMTTCADVHFRHAGLQTVQAANSIEPSTMLHTLNIHEYAQVSEDAEDQSQFSRTPLITGVPPMTLNLNNEAHDVCRNVSSTQINSGYSNYAAANVDNHNAQLSTMHISDQADQMFAPTNIRTHWDVRDMIRIMPEFCPGKGMSSQSFVQRIKQLSRGYGWNEQMLLYAIHDQLKGPARHWINAMPIFNTWSEFERAFLTDFPSNTNSADVHMLMMTKRMGKNETYVDYFYRMLSLGRSGGMADDAINKYIIHGMHDNTVKTILLSMCPSNCADLLKIISGLPVGEKKQYEPYTPVQNSFVKGKDASVRGPNQSSIDKQSRPINSDVVCFRCRERGHIAKNCNMSQGRLGGKINTINDTAIHVTEMVPENDNTWEKVNTINDTAIHVNEEVPEDGNIVNNITQKGKVPELLKTITILGAQSYVKCVALIDSGSSKSLVKKMVADRCGNEKMICNEKLVGFAGGAVSCEGKIEADLQFENSQYRAELLVVSDDIMPYDVIVGIDVLSKGTIVIERGVCHIFPISMSQVDIEADLPDQVVEKFENTLREYSHCFGDKIEQLGKSRSYEMCLKLTSSTPITKKPYQIPIPKQCVVERIVKELMEFGIIQNSRSNYSSPVVLVKKANGEDRLCIDYRALNEVTEKQPWNMPTVDGVLATLAGKSYFTTLDMMSGYYQIAMEESSKQYTAFVTHHGHFEFCRMPFGLRNAPSAFQRMMSSLIKPLGHEVTSYVDEIIIATKTADANIDVLIKFLKLVEQEGLTLRLSKCSFLKRCVAFLGHVVDEHGIKPGSEKTLAIMKYPTPCNQQGLKRFLGLVGFFRKFVPRFAMIASPLNKLLKKDTKYVWSNDCETAFRKIIQMLSEPPVLTIYDINREHQLHTDASSVGLAAILMQKEEDVFKPVAYFSRACSNAESKYHAYELEVLAVVEACERFRMFLLGKPFTILTDCKAISSAKVHRPMIPRVARWLLKLMEFDYHIVHRPGDRMHHVDALSRAPVNSEGEGHHSRTSIMEISTTDWVATLQQQDPKLKLIIDVLSGRMQSDQKKQLDTQYCMRQHRLFFRKGEGKLLLVVPKGMRWRIMRLCHDDVGHPAVDGVMRRALEIFWFPRMRCFVKGYINSCIECSYNRKSQKQQCELYGMEIPRFPFQVLHLDHLGPFIKTRRGHEYILVIVDALTRYSIIAAVRTVKTKPVIDTLNQLTLYFGLPQRIVTDRGTAFTSSAFAEFCENNNIIHIKVAVRTPRANGLAERANQEVLKFLKTTNDQRGWDEYLRTLQWTFNTKINSTTRMTPMDLIYDFPLRDLSGNKLLTALHDDMYLDMNQRRKEAIAFIEAARLKWKQRFDAKYCKPHKYEEGDLVLIESPPTSTGESKKLQPCYRGPFVVKRVLRFDRYVIENIDGVQRSGKRYETVAAADKLKPWCSLFPDADDIEVDDELTRDE